MGLDQHVRIRNEPVPSSVDFQINLIDREIQYWRKHPAMENWMRNLYHGKGGGDFKFNGRALSLRAADLSDLHPLVLDRSLYDMYEYATDDAIDVRVIEDLNFICVALLAISDGKSVYYHSSW